MEMMEFFLRLRCIRLWISFSGTYSFTHEMDYMAFNCEWVCYVEFKKLAGLCGIHICARIDSLPRDIDINSHPNANYVRMLAYLQHVNSNFEF